MDSIELIEQLMRRGWWNEAKNALRRADISSSDRTLEGCLIQSRSECVNWMLEQDLDGLAPSDLLAEMTSRFDFYTARWVMNEYRGEGSLVWRTGSEKANGLMV